MTHPSPEECPYCGLTFCLHCHYCGVDVGLKNHHDDCPYKVWCTACLGTGENSRGGVCILCSRREEQFRINRFERGE